jgi:P27 family predicted phage terminase small subunit
MLEGNRSKTPLPNNEPMPEGRAQTPEYLTGEAKEEWERLTGSMPPDLYTTVDTALLVVWCECLALYRKAQARLVEEGEIVTPNSGNSYQSPWVGIRNKQIQNLITLSSRLGLSPADRTKLTMPDRPEEPSIFDGLL